LVDHNTVTQSTDGRVLKRKIIPVVIESDERIFTWDGNDMRNTLIPLKIVKQ